MAAHLSALVAVAGLPFGHLVGPLIVYLVKGGESAFVGRHAKASLNYQITISLAAIVAIVIGVVAFFLFVAYAAGLPEHSHAGESAAIGMAGLWVTILAIVVICLLVSVVFIIIGTVAAGEGRPFEYPFAIRFIK
ncbi:MAG: DUF4870 domain-containing protein [Candidatus Eremiobacteraeota bacterium]|nr:DUF4870 domain-containing protein [Candidatus Eremiobacteraeota bacterium]MBV8655275.1 DUF4870 domain-containing protein [Candidatus Eremiobacteraeota bacterium]